LEGELDEDTGVFSGDAFLQGEDPDFKAADAQDLLQALAEMGVKKMNGKFVVSPLFSLRSSADPLSSAKGVLRIFRAGSAGRKVIHNGPVVVGTASPDAMTIARHESEELVDTLKVMLSRSLNHVAEQIGRVVGGVKKLEEFAVDDIGIPSQNIHLSTASGLGRNRMTPKDMMMVLLALKDELGSHDMELHDILPVAGVDSGTLKERFTNEVERGSVVAKTGTLTTTDGGVSALVGMMRSQKEDLFFVIFCWHGGVCSFRNMQDNLIRQWQGQRGGPVRVNYDLAQANGRN
ncbi:MAG TPA: D-alanyl-D-alanine carboxypeptidase, partial [Candidatus Obscuribacterales bacterium]